MITTYSKRGFPTIHATGCRHTLRGLVKGKPGPHAIRTGAFAQCVPAQDQKLMLAQAYENWND